jgi:hypothetical protein
MNENQFHHQYRYFNASLNFSDASIFLPSNAFNELSAIAKEDLV